MTLRDLNQTPSAAHSIDHAGYITLHGSSDNPQRFETWRMTNEQAAELRDALTALLGYAGQASHEPAQTGKAESPTIHSDPDLIPRYSEADMDERGQTSYDDGVEQGKAEQQQSEKALRRLERHYRELAQDMTAEQHRRAAALYQARSALETSPSLARGRTVGDRDVNDLLALASYVETGTWDAGPIMATLESMAVAVEVDTDGTEPTDED